MSAAPLPPPPPCGLTRQEVLALRPDVPLVGGLCQNLFRNTDGQFAPCGCPIGEHPSETAPAGKRVAFHISRIAVTNWKSCVSRLVAYEHGCDVTQFMLSAKAVFENDDGVTSIYGRLYAIPGGSEEKLDDKVHLKTTEDLQAQIAMYLKNPSSVDFFYCDGNVSPQTTPVVDTSSATRKRSRDAWSDDSSTSRGSKQTEFTTSLMQRDDGMCVVCDNTENIIGSHIIDVKYGLTGADLSELRISSSYDIQNGLLLCGTCHRAYDNQEFGIDSNCTVQVPALTQSGSLIHRDWRGCQGKVISPRTLKGCWVSGPALQRKYDIYEKFQSEKLNRITSHRHVCRHCTRRFATEKGLNIHLNTCKKKNQA